MTRDTLDGLVPVIERNLSRLRRGVTGEPHERNLHRWQVMVDTRDLPGLKRVSTGLDRDSIEMREVSPLRGLLSQQERSEVLGQVG